MISRAASSACTAWKSGTRKTTEPPRFSGSRGEVSSKPAASTSSTSSAVCRIEFSRIRSTPISAMISYPALAA